MTRAVSPPSRPRPGARAAPRALLPALVLAAACGGGADPTPGPPVVDPVRSTVVASGLTATADGRDPVTITVTARDAAGAPVGGVPVVLGATGTGNALAPASAVNGPDGVATAALRSTVAGAKVVSATAAGVALGGPTVTFLAGPASAAASGLAASRLSATADGADAVALAATVLDALGNPIAGLAVTFSASGAGNVFEPPVATTGADGVAATSLTSTRAGARLVSAAAGPLTLDLPAAVAFLAGPPAAAASSLVASRSTATADGVDAVLLTATLADAFGNPVEGAPFTFGAGGAGNVLDPLTAATGPDGAAASLLRSTRAGPRLLTATTGGLTLQAAAEVTFLPGAPSAAASTLVASGATATADGADAVVLTATVADAHGNPVPGVLLAFAATGAGNALTPASAATGADGVAVAALRSTQPGAKATSATGGGLALAGPAVTFLQGPLSPTLSTLAASRSSATADGADAVVLTATLRDTLGNPAEGVLVTFAASGSGNSLAPASAVTGPDGVAAASLRSTRAEAKLLSAAAGALALAGPPVTFLPGPPAAARSTLAASPGTATADGLEAVTLTAAVADAQGNPAAGVPVTFAASGAGNSLTPASAVTGPDGVATALLRSTRAEAKAPTAAVGGLVLTGPAVTFLPGPPAAAASALTVSRPTAVADGVDAMALAATLADAQGNPVPGVAVTFGASGTQNVLDPVVATTAADGTAVASLRTTRAGARLVSAAAGGLTLDAPAEVTFLAGPAAPAASTLVASRGTATADGVDAVALTATLADANGNPVAGVTVAFEASGTQNALSPPAAVTGADGVATALLRSVKAEAKSLSASAGGLTLPGPPVTFLAGPVSAAASTLTVSRSTATADGVDGIVVTATLADAQGNPVAGAPVTFGATGAGNAFDPPVAVTGADGVARSTLRSTVAGVKDLSAFSDPVTVAAAAPVSFLAPAAPAGLALSATPGVARAGVDAVTVTATATDADGLPVAGAPVAFASSAAFATITPPVAVTGADGTATATLTATASGSVVVGATAGGLAARLPRAVEFVGTGAALQITEVGNAWFANRPAWIEVFNNTAAPLDLALYALRATAVSTATGFTAGDVTFTLPSLVIPPATSAVLLGGTGGARAGPRVALVSNAASQVPYWSGLGFVELLRAGQTVDFVRFGASTVAPRTASGWSGASAPAFPTGPAFLRRTLARAFDRRDAGTAADWSAVSFPTAGGPNDVLPGTLDEDGDGVPDSAEVAGGTYAGLDLFALGARPGVRDVFVELDRMATADPGATPQREALDRWLAMYPPHGIAVHLDAGSLFAAEPGRPHDLGQADSLLPAAACAWLDVAPPGCTAGLHDLKAQHLELARQNLFHYLLFALNDTTAGVSLAFGRAEVGGNDVLVTMANMGFATSPPVARNQLVNRQRAVLAHEFGHNLGLLHGGHEEVPDKPNYLSVMAYLYGDRGLPDPAWADAGQRWLQARGLLSADPCQIRDGLCADPAVFRVDYSDGSGLPLDEAALDEALGLGRPGAAPVDWDRSGATGAGVAVDLNGDGLRTVLADSDDWGRLALPFATNNGFNALLAPGEGAAGRPPLMPLVDDAQPVLP